ncbi:GlnR-family transcriptional regulator [Euzebya pacifica]|uniref:GlnR-family transcriptional regulator n=1 Tax=Euzebya pacifica TaxID=1608957 RepID=A0A346Y4R5_9ACTN|nr:response regulator transcription factor [Euzebya pacifica]AXV09462.1 GlnR-family transcriptional regulator [Euzebya pacifica]
MQLLVLIGGTGRPTELLPALEFLDHTLVAATLEPDSLTAAPDCEVIVVDATSNLAGASQTCRAAATSEVQRPILVVVGEGGLAALKPTWGFDDIILPKAGPAELETRIRLLAERESATGGNVSRVGDLSIDENTYVVRLRGEPVDLTFREFELLSYLAANPGRVFTRSQLLAEVWGYDYFGGTRTVDVHVRRLRAKLGHDYDMMIGTVRGVGYKLDPQAAQGAADT